MGEHELYMQRCLQLAQLGAGKVAPNPLVGAVIVHQNRIIGEGWHRFFGGPHAEVNAIREVQEKALLKEATLYCSLEPCHHFGKTPPCVDLIIAHQLKKVVICNLDPNPLVGGKSIQKMRAAGIEVITGVLEKKGAWLNRFFFHWIRHHLPYVVLKWAQSSDGFISRSNARTPISSPSTQRMVHRWRSEMDGILVGTRTALIDNPQLDTRFYPTGRLTRITLDRHGKLPLDHHLLDDRHPTLIFGPPRTGNWHSTAFIEFNRGDTIQQLLQRLQLKGISTLLVEGGTELIQSFLEAGAWQEIRVIQNHQQLSQGLKGPQLPPNLYRRESFQLHQDQINIYTPSQALG